MFSLDNDIFKAQITPKEAWLVLNQHHDSILVDVRQEYEWQSKGYADISDLPAKLIKMTLSENFTQDLSEAISNKDTKILFICAKGIRSKIAANAMSLIGYNNCYNIIGGMEQWCNSGLAYKRD